MRIPVTIQVVLGSAIMPVANLMKLRRGSAIPLDHRVGEPVDVVVNGRTVARGEVVVVEDDTSRFGISLTESSAATPPTPEQRTANHGSVGYSEKTQGRQSPPGSRQGGRPAVGSRPAAVGPTAVSLRYR
jgi:Flagellar motor switch/type III secretory pathway protein